MTPADLVNFLDHMEGQCHCIENELTNLRALITSIRHNSESPPAFRSCIQNLPSGKMNRAVLFNAIISQYEDFTASRGRYNVKEFRQLCEPLIAKHFHAQDVELDREGTPKWYGRFSYAHCQHASNYGYIHEANGFFVMVST
jgi:hypothetical protein